MIKTREQTIEALIDRIPKDALIIACNGKLGRELFELRKKRKEPNNDFIMVGSMGCALGIAIGASLHTRKHVVCLLGDGNFLMKMGSLATALKYCDDNLHIIILNNDAHDSTGGQKTSFWAIKDLLPYKVNEYQFISTIDILPGARKDLGRPDISPAQITKNFKEHAIRDYPLPTEPYTELHVRVTIPSPFWYIKDSE